MPGVSVCGGGTPREGDGKFGRKRAIRQGSHSPTSPGAQSLLPAGRLGLNLCVRASIPGTNRRRRSSPPDAAAYFEGANQSLGRGLEPRPLSAQRCAGGWRTETVNERLSVCLVGVTVKLENVWSSPVKAASERSGMLLFPGVWAASNPKIRSLSWGFQKHKPTQREPVLSRSLSDRAPPFPFTLGWEIERGTLQSPLDAKGGCWPFLQETRGKGIWTSKQQCNHVIVTL